MKSTHAERVVKALAKHRLTFNQLREVTNLSKRELDAAIHVVRMKRPDLMYGKFDKTYWFSDAPTWYSNQTDLSRVLPLEGMFGFVTDTHLCSVAERLDIMEAAYTEFERLGISAVFHTGDLSDGWFEYRGHHNFVKVVGDQEQAKYVVNHYPKRKGIKTYVIGGN